jgi:hypothetical protein
LQLAWCGIVAVEKKENKPELSEADETEFLPLKTRFLFHILGVKEGSCAVFNLYFLIRVKKNSQNSLPFFACSQKKENTSNVFSP